MSEQGQHSSPGDRVFVLGNMMGQHSFLITPQLVDDMFGMFQEQQQHEEEDLFPFRDDVIQAHKQLKCLKRHMDNFVECTRRLGTRITDVPEKICGENNFGALISSGLRVCENIKKFSESKELLIFTTLGDRISEEQPKTPTAKEWANLWMNQKDLVDQKPSGDEDSLCNLCLENLPSVKIKGCYCKEMNCCFSCILNHYYTSTAHCTKTSSNCPFCKAEFNLSNIVTSKESFIKTRLKLYCTGIKIEETAPKCEKCQISVADSYMSCCKASSEEKRCAECLFGEVYEREVEQDKTTCPNCRKKHSGFVVCRTFRWEEATEMTSPKKARTDFITCKKT